VDRPLFLPRRKLGVVQAASSLVRGRAEQLVVLSPWDVPIVLGMHEAEAQPGLGVPDNVGQPVRGMPLVHYEAVEDSDEPRPRRKGAQQGDNAADAVAAEHRGQVAEAGDEDDTRKLDPLEREPLGNAADNRGSETVSEEDDATRRDACHVDGPIDDCRRIGDQPVLARHTSGVAKAAIVDGNQMVRGCVSQRMVRAWPDCLCDVTCILSSVSACSQDMRGKGEQRARGDEPHGLLPVSMASRGTCDTSCTYSKEPSGPQDLA